jgi:Zn-dependent protease with chaperone function
VNTSIVNAASVGGRGIFFTTGIMKRMPDEQIRAVVGHELGHHRHVFRDQPVLLAIEAAISFAGEVKGWSFQRLTHKLIKPTSRLGGTAT